MMTGWILLNLVASLVGCTDGKLVDVEAACSPWIAQPLAKPHRCVGGRPAPEAIACCLESEGRGVEVGSNAVQATSAALLQVGVDERELVSEAAALCIADTQGLNPRRDVPSATMTVAAGSVRWTVMSWGASSCDSATAGQLGGAEGCGLIIDAVTGVPQFAASVSSTVSCQ
jgi:hypothetical protein